MSGPFSPEHVAWLDGLDVDYDEKCELVRLEMLAAGFERTFREISKPIMCAAVLPWVTSEVEAARIVGQAALALWIEVQRQSVRDS